MLFYNSNGVPTMTDNLYSVKQAAEITEISRQSIRAYTGSYARWFSTEATPQQGGERRFTRADLKLIKFIFATVTRDKITHEQVQERLAAGALEAFDWEPDTDAHRATSEPFQHTNTSLVPVERLQAAQALMLDAQRREQEAIARAEEQARELREQAQQRERELLEQVNQLQRELGKTEGELATIRASKPKGFWARLFGGE
jgi:DNA-binding transcriptional MerR regulator